MRRIRQLSVAAFVGVAGCMSPFTWPDDRRQAESVPKEAQAPAVPLPNRDYLQLAAEAVDRGDEAAALPHLTAHVNANPNAVMIRAYLAELLMRQDRTEESASQFEQVVADAQRETGPARGHMVHCHTRLMELAEERGDRYSEELHRGIGLLLLVRRWDAAAERSDEAAAERTLTKAVAALRTALEESPDDARASFYLAEVYDRLGQSSAADSLRRTMKVAVSDNLTPAERELLRLQR